MTTPTDSESEGVSPGPDERGLGRRPRRGGGVLPSGFSTVRDVVSFVAGLAIIGNEVFLSKSAEPAAITVGIAMTGLPLVFGADEKKRPPPDDGGDSS